MAEKIPYVVKASGFSPAEIEGIASVHVSEIRSGFLSSLGMKPLSLLYEFAARSETSVLLAVFGGDGSLPMGIIWGTPDCPALYRDFLKRRGFRALMVFAPRLLSARRFKRALQTLIYPMKGKKSVDLPKAEILNFAVRPDYRGTGIAEALFRQLMQALRAQGISKVRIVTGQEQIRAHKFYERMGARAVGSEGVHEERDSQVYVYDIP